MGLFGRKKPEPALGGAGGGQVGGGGGVIGGKGGDRSGGGDVPEGGAGGYSPDPGKARKWFEFAKAASDSTNYDYALNCYANGLKFDPGNMVAHTSFYETALRYRQQGGKPAGGKELKLIEDSSHPVPKFAAAEFAWFKDLTNPSLALGAIDAALKADQREFGKWAAKSALALMRKEKKVSKGTWIKAKDLFSTAGAWNESLSAAEAALQIDPSDNDLAHEIKNISAQRAMDQGGYEKAAGQEGGFRAFVKDADKQRELQDAESIVTTESAEQRLIERVRLSYEKTPTVPDIINQYAQLLKKQGTPEAEQKAHDIYLKGYADTSEYRFRMAAGDIEIERVRRILAGLDSQVQAQPGNAAVAGQVKELRTKLLELERDEFTERTEKYPTDRGMRLRLGEILYELGQYEDAMGCFQSAKDEPKLKVRAGHMLGRCFAKENWHQEAIAEYREALAGADVVERDRELPIRYDLMVSLIAEARNERSPDVAREALDICQSIIRKDINYRDIKARRKEIDTLIREITGQATP